MILSEARSKTKWCPYMRIIDIPALGANGALATNRFSSDDLLQDDREQTPLNVNCIAAKCMAWRWAGTPAEDNPPMGYCGAFGVPK